MQFLLKSGLKNTSLDSGSEETQEQKSLNSRKLQILGRFWKQSRLFILRKAGRVKLDKTGIVRSVKFVVRFISRGGE